MSLIGLVRHMTEVERNWFRRVIGGEGDDTAGPIYFDRDTNQDGDFDELGRRPPRPTSPRGTPRWRSPTGSSPAYDLDDTRHHAGFDVDMSVRWIFTHMIEEYARHNGHADLLRERIDGATGE